jgi:hypothetical protein
MREIFFAYVLACEKYFFAKAQLSRKISKACQSAAKQAECTLHNFLVMAECAPNNILPMTRSSLKKYNGKYQPNTLQKLISWFMQTPSHIPRWDRSV